jgi:hypothetical protein
MKEIKLEPFDEKDLILMEIGDYLKGRTSLKDLISNLKKIQEKIYFEDL